MKLFGTLWSEFKAFAFKGNMIELAVAVIIGGAFGTVVTSLVSDIIMPCVTIAVYTTRHAAETGTDLVTKTAHAAVSTVGLASTEPSTQPTTQPIVVTKVVPPPPVIPPPVAAPADTKPAPTEAVHLEWDIIGPGGTPIHIGRFIGALINFLIVAAAVFFMVVKLMGGVMKRMSKPEVPGEPTTRECPECLSIIPIKAKRCSHCTTVIAPEAV